MFDKKQVSCFIKRVLLRSAKLPIIYFILGIALMAFAYLDDIFPPLAEWEHLFELTDKIGTLLIALAAATFVYYFIIFCCRWYEKKLADQRQVASLILTSLRRGLRIIYILALINIAISIIAPKKFYITVANNIINCIIIGLIGWIAIQILYTLEAILYQHMIKQNKSNYLRVKTFYTKIHILRNIATVVIIVLTIAAILMTFSSVRNIGISLLASAGFLTAIVGFAAQKMLFSLFSGLQLAITQPIKIGDTIVIENTRGVIEEITFFHVILKLDDKKTFNIPINFFIEKPFENNSHEESLTSTLYLYVDYLIPIDPLRKELERILQHAVCWDGKTHKLEVSNLLEHAVQLCIQLSAANADNLSDLKAYVREKMLSFMREHYAEHFPKIRLKDKTLHANDHVH